MNQKGGHDTSNKPGGRGYPRGRPGPKEALHFVTRSPGVNIAYLGPGGTLATGASRPAGTMTVKRDRGITTHPPPHLLHLLPPPPKGRGRAGSGNDVPAPSLRRELLENGGTLGITAVWNKRASRLTYQREGVESATRAQ